MRSVEQGSCKWGNLLMAFLTLKARIFFQPPAAFFITVGANKTIRPTAVDKIFQADFIAMKFSGKFYDSFWVAQFFHYPNCRGGNNLRTPLKTVITSDPELVEGERGDPDLVESTRFVDCRVAPLLAIGIFRGAP